MVLLGQIMSSIRSKIVESIPGLSVVRSRLFVGTQVQLLWV